MKLASHITMKGSAGFLMSMNKMTMRSYDLFGRLLHNSLRLVEK